MARAGAPVHRTMINANVVRTTRLTPHFVRVTIGGESLAEFEHKGLDQLVRVFFPRPTQTALRMPTAANSGWLAQLLLIPVHSRPHVRNYTVRAFRHDPLELDIDFVVHGDGPASTWALATQPGDPVGLFDEGTMYEPRTGADWQLIVADESAVPAALSIAEQTAASVDTIMLLEVPHADDVMDVAPAASVTWLPRKGEHDRPGTLALEALTAATLPNGRPSVFLAGESALATNGRRHLVNVRGFAKADVAFWGYWKHGRGSLG